MRCLYLLPCVAAVFLWGFTSVANRAAAQSVANSSKNWEVLRIFVPTEEVGDLVPRDYNPIEIEDLTAALAREKERRAQSPVFGPHLSEAIYVVQATTEGLSSDQSRYAIRSSVNNSSLPIDNLSVALRGSAITPTDDKSLLPNLRFTPEGTTQLTNIQGDARYWFGFSASPTVTSAAQSTYELRLPPATLGRMLITAPADLVLSSPDVVITTIENPRDYLPENWPSLATFPENRWYLLHLSGRSSCQIVTEVAQRKDALAYQQFVRRASAAYVASDQGLFLSSDFELDRLQPLAPIELLVSASLRIRSLTIDDEAVDFQATGDASDAKRTLKVPLPANVTDRARVRVEAFVDAQFPFEGTLPSIEIGRGFAWEGRTTLVSENNLLVEQMSLVGRSDCAKPRLDTTTIGKRWSVDWLGTMPTLSANIRYPDPTVQTNTFTRLAVQQNWIAATTNLRTTCSGLKSNELRLSVGQGWFIDDLTIEQSDVPINVQLPDGEAGDVVLTWDRLNEQMAINLQIVAHLPRDTSADSFSLTAPRVVTAKLGNQDDRFAIEPSGKLQLSPNPLMHRLQLRESDLLPWQTPLLTKPAETQLFRSIGDQLPPLVLNRANGSSTAKIKTIVHSLANQLRVTYVIEATPTTGAIDGLTCLLNVPSDVALPTWRVNQVVDGELMQVTKAVVTSNRSDNQQDTSGETRFDFQLPEATSSAFQVVGEMTLPIPVSGSAQLPLVTTSLATETWLIIPRQLTLSGNTSALAALPASVCCEEGPLASALLSDAENMAAYRYDPSLVASVDLQTKLPPSNGGAWVWSQHTESWLYSDGRVAHRSEWLVFAPNAMQLNIDLPGGWVMHRVTVAGSVQPLVQPAESQKLSIPIPRGDRVQVVLQATNQVGIPGWLTRLELPHPTCSLVSMQSSRSLWLQPGRMAVDEIFQHSPVSLADRILPVAWWQRLSPTPQTHSESSSTVDLENLRSTELGAWRRVELTNRSEASTLRPHSAITSDQPLRSGGSHGEPLLARATIIDRSSLCGLCIAITLALAGWTFVVLGKRLWLWWSSITLATLLLLLIQPAYILLAQIVMLSLVCSALARLICVVTSASTLRSSQTSRRGSTIIRASAVSSMVWLCVLLNSPAAAQQMPTGEAPKKESPTVFGVLIPIDETGELSAKHVYAPRKLMNLLSSPETTETQDSAPQILSAKYALKLQNGTSLTTSYVQEFTAEFDLQFNSTESPLRLPFQASQVQLLRASVSGQEVYIGPRLQQTTDAIFYRPVESGRMRLRLQLIPQTSETADRTAIQVAIPRIASATLDVSANEPLDINVPSQGTLRRLTPSTWLAEIGPTDSLRANWPTRNQRLPTTNPAPAQSDTWLHINEGQVVADCQLRISGASTLPKQLRVTVDAAWEPVGSQWQDVRLVSSEASSLGTRRTYLVNRVNSNDRAIVRVLLVPRSADSTSTLNVPFLSTQDSAVTNRTLAVSTAGRPRWRLVGNDFWNRLNSTASELGWEASKPTMTDAWRVPPGSLNGSLQRVAPSVKPLASEVNELQLLASGPLLNYRVDWTQAIDDQVLKFELPPEAIPRSVMLNASPVEYKISRVGQRKYLTLQIARGPVETRSVQIQSQLESTSGGALPRTLLQDLPITASQYQVNCGTELDCEIVTPTESGLATDLPNFVRPTTDSTVMLSTLTAPIGTAELGNLYRDSVYLPLRYQCKERPMERNFKSVMSLTRSEQGWRASVEILLAGEKLAPFVFFEIPSAIRDLIESSGSPYRISAAAGPGRSTLCLLPRIAADGTVRASFEFRLPAVSGSQTLPIPDIHVVSNPLIRPVLALPQSIDGQLVRWSRAGRRLADDWLESSGWALDAKSFVCFELSDSPQQTSWRAAEAESKPAEVLFGWVDVQRDSAGRIIAAVNYWVDPNNHLDLVATIPAGAQLIGIQSGTGAGAWHRDAEGRCRILLQPSYLPVPIRMLLVWPESDMNSPVPGSTQTAGAFTLHLPTLDAAGITQFPVAVHSDALLSEVSSHQEQAVAPEFKATVEDLAFEDFANLSADRWSKMLTKSLPLVADLDESEVASWLRQWSPSELGLSLNQPLAPPPSTGGGDANADRGTVGSFWDWYLKQTVRVNLDVDSVEPPEGNPTLSQTAASLNSNLLAPASQLLPGHFGEVSADAKWFIIDVKKSDPEDQQNPKDPSILPSSAWAGAVRAPLQLDFQPAPAPQTIAPRFFAAAALLIASATTYMASKRLKNRSQELLALNPWLYWVFLSAVCGFLLPVIWPAVIIAVTALGMLASQWIVSRRRQSSARRF